MNDVSTDLVSVIIPFLNGSHWLIESLESVLNQTYINWEIIVIDDGSEEKHSLIARHFCRQHLDKIIYTEHDGHVNKGVTISRNEAAKLAKGKYLAFLDADDIWLPQKLTNQLTRFKKHPEVQAVCEPCIHWYSWQDETAENYLEPVGAPYEKVYAPHELNKLLYPLCFASPPPPSGILITQEAFKRIGGFEPAFSGIYELYEDQAFLSKLYLNEIVLVSGDADFMYRKRADSMSSAATNMERYQTVRRFYFNWLENYMHKNKINDEAISHLINKARKELNKVPAEASAFKLYAGK